MEAICKADFDRRVAAYQAVEMEKARRKELAKQAEKEKRQRFKNKKPRKSTTASEEVPTEDEATDKEASVPVVGFHDIFGVWFFGKLKDVIVQTGHERFHTDLTKTMHVFVDVEPKKLSDGIHDITVYGHECVFYKWTAQGYPRGLVVLKGDELANRTAQVYMKSRTWSWVLDNDLKAELESIRR